MIRVLALTGLVVLLRGINADPYTWRSSASDAYEAAPSWRMALLAFDCCLLILFAVAAWNRRLRAATSVLCVEALLNVALVGLEVRSDGLSRFLGGFNSTPYLNAYFALLAVRFGMILLLALLLGTEDGR